jgi:hypothetical protein
MNGGDSLSHHHVEHHHEHKTDSETDAATITPDAKPNNVFCSFTDISPFIKNTKAEPSIVPSNGINSPIINVVIIGCKGTDK